MSNQNTLQGDVLDILFANRNQQYGAYLLRRTYSGRLKRSIALMLGGLLLLSVGFTWRWKSIKVPVTLPTRPPVVVHPIDLQPDPKPIEKPIVQRVHHPVAPQAAPPPVAMQRVTPPLLVDKVDPTKTLPDMPSLDNRPIGPATVQGPATTGIPSGTGTAVSGGGNKGENEIYEGAIVERMPQYPGGEEALRKFFMRYLQTPDDMEAGSKVKVVIRFVVGKDGSLSAYAVEQSGGEVFDAEVIRVLRKMPKWTPGIQNGRPVSVYFNLPVTFMRPGD